MRGLREAHETYRHLVEGIPAILYVDAVDDLSTSLYTSPQLEQVLGIPVEEWRKDPGLWLERMNDDDRERVLAEHRRSNRTGEPFRTEYRMSTTDGREIWIRDEAVLVRDENDNPMYWRGIMVDITERRRTEEKLRRSLAALHRTMDDRRRLLIRLESAQGEERRRIADDLHDDSVQVMTAAYMRAQGLVQRLDDPSLRADAEALRDTLRDAVERLRHLLFELHPPSLDRDGLVTALRSYGAGREGPTVVVEDDLAAEPPGDIRTLVFRIAQEAITNARKHAEATTVTVALDSTEDGVRLRVVDDGAGFDLSVVDEPDPGHIGLSGMIERAELAGGRLRIDSRRGAGTAIEAWLPVVDADRASTRAAGRARSRPRTAALGRGSRWRRTGRPWAPRRRG
jgi:PAS domain S-box-containing protein